VKKRSRDHKQWWRMKKKKVNKKMIYDAIQIEVRVCKYNAKGELTAPHRRMAELSMQGGISNIDGYETELHGLLNKLLSALYYNIFEYRSSGVPITEFLKGQRRT